MTEVLLALFAGFLVGLLFTAIMPAPPVLAGIMGIVGIFLGGAAWKLISERFFQ